MFEAAELGQKVSKEDFQRQEGPMRSALLQVQGDCQAAKVPVIILVGGVDGAGKGETVNTLMEWFDPRGIRVWSMGEPTDEERERPRMWRYWRRTPAKGKMSIFLGSWYTMPIMERAWKRNTKKYLETSIHEINAFEHTLAVDGSIILKFWLHLSKKSQRKRFERLEADPLTEWRVTRHDWSNLEIYDRFRKISEEVVRQTSTAVAPWHVIDSEDHNYRHLTVCRIIRDVLTERLAVIKNLPPRVKPTVPLLNAGEISVLGHLDQTRAAKDDVYDKELPRLQARLHKLSRRVGEKRRSVVVVLEGQDAAGKGGAIRRVTQAMDSRDYEVIPIAAPNETERQYHYLWRFWLQLPRIGRVAIYDRSWYGRVLVEPAEGFCSEEEWERAYAEINDFEEELTRHGAIVVKFWVAITKDEQLKRFKDRENVPFKMYKIGPEDWRNRDKWEMYDALVHRMVAQTSTSHAPWTLVEGNDKKHARLKILSTLCQRIEEEL